jgi:hypothetical protein
MLRVFIDLNLGITVREFSRLSKHLKENEIVQIFSRIIKYLTDPKAIGKDIYSTCIKATLKEMPPSSCESVGKIILPDLIQGLSCTSLEVRELCFDTFNDFINTYDFVLLKESEKIIKNKDNIINNAIESIKIDNVGLRKTVGNFLGNFSVILNKNQLSSLITGLIKRVIDLPDQVPQQIAYINALNYVAKITAHKQAEYIPKIMETLMQYMNANFLKGASNYDDSNDLAESCLSITETYIMKNTVILHQYNEKLVEIVNELIEYDPNYSYDVVMESNENYASDWGEDYGAFVQGEDTSWKVRRGAARVANSLAKSRMEMNRELNSQLVQKLVICLRERDENVKIEICLALNSMLRNLVVEEKEEEGKN